MPIFQIKNVSNHSKLAIWKITESFSELSQLLINKGFDKSNIIPLTKNEVRVNQWIATRLLLFEFYNTFNISYDSYGKPLLDKDVFISISHSKKYVVVLINETHDCGVDIEKISIKVDTIKFKFLSTNELKEATSLEILTIFWGAKEALYKYFGKKGVIFNKDLILSDFNISEKDFKGKILKDNLDKTLPLQHEKIEDYVLVYTM